MDYWYVPENLILLRNQKDKTWEMVNKVNHAKLNSLT